MDENDIEKKWTDVLDFYVEDDHGYSEWEDGDSEYDNENDLDENESIGSNRSIEDDVLKEIIEDTKICTIIAGYGVENHTMLLNSELSDLKIKELVMMEKSTAGY